MNSLPAGLRKSWANAGLVTWDWLLGFRSRMRVAVATGDRCDVGSGPGGLDFGIHGFGDSVIALRREQAAKVFINEIEGIEP